MGALMQGHLIHPETRLAEQVQVADDQHVVLEPHVRLGFLAAVGARATLGQVKVHLENMRPLVTLVTADGNSLGQINFDLNLCARHDTTPPCGARMPPGCYPTAQPERGQFPRLRHSETEEPRFCARATSSRQAVCPYRKSTSTRSPCIWME